jgi:hypothetical protein
MHTLAPKRPFEPKSPDAAGVVSWVHFGDLHMTKAGEQNHLDLAEIVDEVNRAFADSVSFVFLPGDVGGQTYAMKRVGDSHIWEADVPTPREGTHPLNVSFKDADGKVASDKIRVAVGQRTERKSEQRDQDNALEAWPEYGLLGTQLGPNKNGKKW